MSVTTSILFNPELLGDVTDNTRLWEKLREIHTNFQEQFSRNGKEFTAISHVHGRALMTALFGPQGTGWGYDISDWAERRNTLICRVTLWYKPYLIDSTYSKDFVAQVHEYGGTAMNNGDDDVAKKTVTDGLSRCFMCLGHGSDIYAGLKNDNKYLRPQQEAQRNDATGQSALPAEQSKGQVTQEPGSAEPASASDPFRDYADELIAKYPVLRTCDCRINDNKIYFLTGIGENADELMELGFKKSRKYEGGLFLCVGLPDHIMN